MTDRVALENELRRVNDSIRFTVGLRDAFANRVRTLDAETHSLIEERARIRVAIGRIPPVIQVSPQADLVKVHMKVIKKSELQITEENACGVCLEQHTKGDTVTCNCGHAFGQVCFNQWKQSCLTSHKSPSCPTCRTPTTTLVGYRQRAPPTKKPTV